jgi:hypothetical protein
VLADTAIRGHDLDEAKATEAKKLAEEAMKNAKSDIDLAKAQGEFAAMAAQIAAIQKLRKKYATPPSSCRAPGAGIPGWWTCRCCRWRAASSPRAPGGTGWTTCPAICCRA